MAANLVQVTWLKTYAKMVQPTWFEKKYTWFKRNLRNKRQLGSTFLIKNVNPLVSKVLGLKHEATLFNLLGSKCK